MFITKSYKYNKSGVTYVSGNLPEDATLIEIMDILNADEGYELAKDGERIGTSVWLKSGDSQDNYTQLTINEGE